MGGASAVAVAFPSPQDGWLGAGHVVLRTTSGGLTWYPVPTPGSGQVQQLSFATGARGWLLTSSGLYATVDGGARWLRLKAAPRSLVAIGRTAPGAGWGVTRSGGLWTTADGGRSWSRRPVPGRVVSACFFNGRVGVAATAEVPGQSLWLTTDGGARWANRSVPPAQYRQWGSDWPKPGGWPQQLGCGGRRTIWDLTRFTGYAGGFAHAVFRSANLGRTWMATGFSPEEPDGPTLPGPTAVELAAVGANRAYLVSACGACNGPGTTGVVVTNDGGASWREATVPGVGPTGTAALAVATRSRAWLFGVWGTQDHGATVRLYVTNDAGSTWLETSIEVGATGPVSPTDVIGIDPLEHAASIWLDGLWAQPGRRLFGPRYVAAFDGSETAPGVVEVYDEDEPGPRGYITYVCPRRSRSLTITAITGEGNIVHLRTGAGVAVTLNLTTHRWRFG